MRKLVFIIEDGLHAEIIGKYGSHDDAIAALREFADKPWNEAPNRAPCVDWQTCGRSYEVATYDCHDDPWEELGREAVLRVSALDMEWLTHGRQ